MSATATAEKQEQEPTLATAERIQMAQRAMTDYVSFVTHIAQRLMDTAEHLRLGEDAQAVEVMSDAVEDLGSFVLWVDEIRDVIEAANRKIPEAKALQDKLVGGARSVREALSRDDFADAADQIEGTLIADLMSSGDVADQLVSHLREMAVDAEPSK